MPFIEAVTTIDFPHRVAQQEVKQKARTMFTAGFPSAERLIDTFDNTGIKTRNFCQPLDYYSIPTNFEDRNKEYIRCALEFASTAVRGCLAQTNTGKEQITDLIVVSTTGLATPGIDALLINALNLNPHANRMPLWGLGCAGGVSGMAKASMIANANPDAIVLLLTIELCSLTLIRNDYSKSNFIGSSLFSDGIAACLIKGDHHHPGTAENPHPGKVDHHPANGDPADPGRLRFAGSSSKLYYDSLDMMGWEFRDAGFKVVFSRDIPAFISTHINGDIRIFLAGFGLILADLKYFIFHPGGKKVLDAYTGSLELKDDFLEKSRETMAEYGNMSSATVLYVLKKFIEGGLKKGYGLMLAMGPGFSSEMVLLNYA
jgi:alkylresorcinol/alkylpyrone synthase